MFGLDFYTILGRALFLVAIVPIHEFAHAYAAYKMGDYTAKYSGRLDLNPLNHMDPVGTLLILFTGFGWAKPVPINSNNFRDRKKGIFITSLAGPASNIILAGVGMIIYKLVLNIYMTTGIGLITLARVLAIMISTSVYLALFNLIPLPPLDGWNMLSVFLPYQTYYKVLAYQRQIYFGFIFLIFFTPVISYPLSMLSGVIINILDKITFFL